METNDTVPASEISQSAERREQIEAALQQSKILLEQASVFRAAGVLYN